MVYELWLKTRAGGYIAGPLANWLHLEWSLGLNRTGTLYATFSAADFDRSWYNERLMAELWYAGGNEPLQLLQRYFLWNFGGGWQNGMRVAWIRGFDMNALGTALRIVKAAASTSGAQKTGEATEIMADYITEALLTDVGRDISGEMPLEVSYAGDGATISYTASRGQLGAVLAGCAGVSASEGTPVRYYFEPTLDGGAKVTLKARPYGRDLRGIVGVSVDTGTASDVAWDYESANSCNYGYIGGQGQNEDRDVVEVDVSDGSPLGRREMWAENSQILKGNTTALEAWGAARVWEQRPRKKGSAVIEDTARFRFGYEWRLGDWFTVEDDGVAFDAEVLAVSGAADGGRSEIKAMLRSDDV